MLSCKEAGVVAGGDDVILGGAVVVLGGAVVIDVAEGEEEGVAVKLFEELFSRVLVGMGVAGGVVVLVVSKGESASWLILRRPAEHSGRH